MITGIKISMELLQVISQLVSMCSKIATETWCDLCVNDVILVSLFLIGTDLTHCSGVSAIEQINAG